MTDARRMSRLSRAEGCSTRERARPLWPGRDVGRLLWSLIYWNLRKTWYAMRGRRGAAPCQHLIDVQDGLAPRCEAVWYWTKPGRFRCVCPALQHTEDGWRCAVPANRVRPYWGRTLGAYAVLAAMLYAATTSGLWMTWHFSGYRKIGYADVVWPGNWSRIKPARAAYFRERGRAALEQGDYVAALLALTTAERFQRGGYAERLLLARLWAQAGNVGFAERDVADIMREFPEHAEKVAIAWHDQLLASGHLAPLARLSWERVKAKTGGMVESLWEYSLLYALDHGRLATITDGWNKDGLPKRVVSLTSVLARWQSGDTEGAATTLAAMRFPPEEPLATRWQIEWLARMGRADEAGVVLIRHAATASGFETAALRYTIDALTGDREAAKAGFLAMLREWPLTPEQADRLCALAIMTKDGTGLRRTSGVFALEPLSLHEQTQAASWIAALVCREPALVVSAKNRYSAATGGSELPDVTDMDMKNQNPRDPKSALFIAGYVPLPRQTIYALIAATMEARRSTTATR